MTDRPKIEVVYKGQTLLKGGKRGYTIQKVENGKIVGEERYFAFRKRPNLWSVGIYTVEVPDEAAAKELTTIVGATFSWVREWPNKDEARMWEAESRSLLASIDAAKLAKSKAMKGDQIAAAVAPLAKIYHRLPNMRRAAFKVLVLNLIEKGAFGSDVRDLTLDDDE